MFFGRNEAQHGPQARAHSEAARLAAAESQ